MADHSSPTVTVLVDTYNHERFIETALTSVVQQDYPADDMEILVVDDGSTDATPRLVERFGPRVRLLRKQNGGQGSAFNFGIRQVSGQIVAFLDGDDWWHPGKLTKVIGAMQADPDVGIVGHGIVVQYENEGEEQVLREGFRFTARTVDGARLFKGRRSFLGTSRMTIRTPLLRAIGEVPESIAIEADEYLFTTAAVLSTVQILPESLTSYRIHSGNLYEIRSHDPARVRKKQRALAALARGLAERLGRCDMSDEARALLLELVQTEADRLRLLVGDGFPWETFATEWKAYRMFEGQVSVTRRAARAAGLLPALFLPPRLFYELRGRLTTNELYIRARKRLFPLRDLSPQIQKSSI